MYDEEDDGFAFTRKRSKKGPPASDPGSVIQKVEEEPEPLPAKKPRKKSFSSPTSAAAAGNEVLPKRRSARQSSGKQDDAASQPLAIKKRRKPRGSSESKQEEQQDQQVDIAAKFVQQEVRKEPGKENQEHRPAEITFDATKIALPFADTPIIRRNKEMRKGAQSGSRRSSLGLRGRRASSLIDAGISSGMRTIFPVTRTEGKYC